MATGAILAVLATSACARANPSVVAYVGSDGRVTQSELDTAVSGISQTLQPGQSVQESAVVNALIHGEIAQQVAAANNITITDADRDKLLKGSNLAPLLNIPDAKAVAYDVADAQLVPAKVGSDAYLKAVQSTPVELNPRYGQLNPEDRTIVDGSTGSLSTPAPAAGG
ncbi:hypothetical protein GCM10022236_48590 [Microlunatus ginsengisoli]|uniref:SurA N-terminal domain-containing protein n=2 Tax=Microlunatus ginsengisoli TaxID=363863 RepID=A0ABP7AU78_9ACTN